MLRMNYGITQIDHKKVKTLNKISSEKAYNLFSLITMT